MNTEVVRMQDVVALWYVDERTGGDVVRAACELLVAGVGGPAVGLLAGVQYRHADEEVPDALPDAMAELGLPCHDRGSVAADLAGIRVMAARVESGELAPERFAHWTHAMFGHYGIDEVQPLVWLSDEYEMRLDRQVSNADLDAQVRAEVRRLVA